MFFCVLAGYDVSPVCRYHSELLQSVFAIDGFSRHACRESAAAKREMYKLRYIIIHLIYIAIQHNYSEVLSQPPPKAR